MEIKISEENIRELVKNRSSRTEMVTKSHMWFFNIYFNHYISYPTADFHKEMFRLTEDEDIPTLAMIAFRGSAKSTIFTMSYPIWAILGKQQKKFIIILGQTQRQAKQHLMNIRRELENNELLRSDLGPFKEIEDEWGSYSLVIPKYNARITAASMEQTIRGMRHGQYRPDLIICDDIEDLQSVKTREGRDKIHQWITGEIVPAGDRNTKMVFIGNLLHEDSLLMRLKEKIESGELDGQYLEIPLIDDNGKISWLGKFPNMQSINKEKKKIANEISWQREYMLRIIPDTGQIVHREWLHYYSYIPESYTAHLLTATGVDLAISQKDAADYTAIVSAKVYRRGKELKIFILPNPINEKLLFPDTVEKMKSINSILGKGKIYIEGVGYQPALQQQLFKEGIYAENGKLYGLDKASRLNLITPLICSGSILFPEKGAERLIEQMLHFGVDKHDDLVDALTLLVNQITEYNSQHPYHPFSLSSENDIKNDQDGHYQANGDGKMITAGLLEEIF